MAKRKKTRKQKVLAENKKEIALAKSKEALSSPDSLASDGHPISVSPYVFKMKGTGKISPTRSSVNSIHDYTHLKNDLMKTGILTTSIVVAQLVLYFILQ